MATLHPHRLRRPAPPLRPPARIVPRASARPPPGDRGGDEGVQENLVEMLRLQVGQADIAAFADAEAAKLVESAEAIKREADALLLRRAAEADAGFDAALADINAAADELAAELAAARADAEARAADLAEFEAATAAARSEGHFFKSLYPGGGDATDAAATASIETAAMDTIPTSRPSPVRAGVWTATAVALAGGAVADLFSVAPSLGADAVAGVLAIVLAAGAVVEGRRVQGKKEGGG